MSCWVPALHDCKRQIASAGFKAGLQIVAPDAHVFVTALHKGCILVVSVGGLVGC